MYITINEFEAKEIMQKVGRDNFTRRGLEIIMQWLDDASDCEQGHEFDPVEIDCEFIELDLTTDEGKSLLLKDYGYLVEEDEEDEECKIEAIIEEIQDRGVVIYDDPQLFIFTYNF